MFILKKLGVILILTNLLYGAGLEIPNYLDKKDILNAEFKCLSEPVKYNKKDQKYVDILWDETLVYLKAYALALTNGDLNHCMSSDEAIYDTTKKDNKMCIMDRRDMKNMVKNIYQILFNKEKAKVCFSARRDVNWIYNPGGELQEKSPVAKWANRMTFEEFFDKKVKNKDVRKRGKEFTKNFYKMVTGDEIHMPKTFPYDVSANSLPNLWAAAGWFPMYAEESKRNEKNFLIIRGGYAYAEILGHWGLLRIDEINGQKVGAEVGMTVQVVDSLYPYHNHAMPEIYYNMRMPACVKQFKSFAIREDNPLLKTVEVNKKFRRVQFDAGAKNEPDMWVSGSAMNNSLLYLHENTIHAFEVDGKCEAKPEERALVSVWARTNAHDKRNDYGTTLLCESAEKPGTPAHRGEMIQCDLTNTKW
ncbi:conserved hypothetical protein [Arcobacter nitrofigilis DSM 7299]|uniref:Uncharacterized protein n=1 Tax=Arcobacter nitrofigilis (strain ATCC 33309 / DSM 7299 / CCUG 15893 / LMG 7604 / NCTC 12251 / CI) TaxID=572480 RepID=D5V6Z5_ARCNC|nr:hypothetical protein [Arcobacter nitrofigilis]ADG94415.1 conserved hypothetical protein [Arcobacter nitrofigilis DSM 7299]